MRLVVAMCLAGVVYAMAVWWSRYGLSTRAHGGDLSLYASDAHAIAAGKWPYRDLYFEYPPGALAPILAVEPAASYELGFKWLMAVLGLGTLAVAAVVLRAQARRLEWLLPIAISPLAIGSVFLNRYDVWPALLTVAAVALLLRKHPLLAFAVLALGADSKIYPAAVAVPAAVWLWRTEGARVAKRAIATFAAVALAIVLPFAALGPGGVRFSFTIQATRHLQSESLGGSILLALDRLGVYSAHLATGKPGSLDLFGGVPTGIGLVTTAVALAGIAWTGLSLWRGPVPDVARLVTASAAAVAFYVAFGKVESPQYLVWLVPLVPLVGGLAGRTATALVLAALVLTQIEFDHLHRELDSGGGVVWVLLARDLAVVAVALVLAAGLRARRQPDVEPAAPNATVARAPE